MKYKNNLSEDAICFEFVEFLENIKKYKEIDFIYLHVPNEISSNKNPAFGHKLKKLGKLPGAPDYIFMWDNDFGCIEFKTEKGKLSDNQKNFQTHCKLLNVKYEIARSCDQGIDILKEWGLLKGLMI